MVVIKSSETNPQKGDILFIINEDLQYRFFRMNIKGELNILE